jgi:hypothetical protein
MVEDLARLPSNIAEIFAADGPFTALAVFVRDLQSRLRGFTAAVGALASRSGLAAPRCSSA